MIFCSKMKSLAVIYEALYCVLRACLAGHGDIKCEPFGDEPRATAALISAHLPFHSGSILLL